MPDSSSPAVRDVGLLILTLRGQKVILDSDLAKLYGVSTKAFNQAIKRNLERFPDSFRFQLSQEEADAMRSHFVTASKRNVRFLPFAFTEHGALMAANVLNSPNAIKMSVAIVEAFIRLRQMALSIDELSRKVAALERGFRHHGEQFDAVFKAIRQLLTPPDPPKRKIGFHSDEE